MAVGSSSKAKAKASSHPPYTAMITAAIKSLKDRSGSSRQAILKYITANYKVDGAKVGGQLKLALNRAVAAGSVNQAKGTGASGSFKLPGKDTAVAKKKKVVKRSAKKPAAKKPAVKRAKVVRKSKPKKSVKATKKPVVKKAKRSATKKSRK